MAHKFGNASGGTSSMAIESEDIMSKEFKRSFNAFFGSVHSLLHSKAYLPQIGKFPLLSHYEGFGW